MKIDADQLFRKRLHAFSTEFIRYAQYMANGGVLFIAIFLTGLLSLYYRGIIAMIPPWFPLAHGLALVIALFVTRSPHRTFLLEADLLFLTPHETRLGGYFRKAQVYNFAVQSVGLFVLLLLLSPVYAGVVGATGAQLWLYWLVPFLLKGWNVHSSWIFLRLSAKKTERLYTLARFGLSYLLLAWVLSAGQFLSFSHVPFAGVIGAALLVWLHVQMRKVQAGLPLQWYRLLAVENRLRHRFYQIMNNFRDVPALQRQVKPRFWLTALTQLVPYSQANTARHLYVKTFLRSGELAGMYGRLVLIGAALMLLLPSLLAKTVAAALLLLMTASQLNGLWRQQSKRNSELLLFPVPSPVQRRAFVWMRSILLLLQVAVHVAAGMW
ncbi:ABC transporter permease [Brevibacillus agri]|uniref:ABC transporter permease n=1 Tax=Brevibacillus agri TaxID=51101 RepID=UPI001EE50370|nr:ABC transporter permease [Brevibacillus agri]